MSRIGYLKMSVDLFFEKQNRSLAWISYGVIVFWAVWALLVALGDSVNLMQEANLLPSYLVFTSKNYSLLAKSFALYQIQSKALMLICYSIIIVFTWIITAFFWRAVFAVKQNLDRYLQKCYTAFLVSFAIEAFFILSDEIFLQYELEHGHMARLGFKLITFLVFLALNNISWTAKCK